MSDVYWKGPATVCARATREFTDICRVAVGIAPTRMGPFRVGGIGWEGEWFAGRPRVDYVNPVQGAGALVTEAAARYVAVRSDRVGRSSGDVLPLADGWQDALRRHFPGLFDGRIEVCAGWADLLRMLAEWLVEEGYEGRGFAALTVRGGILHAELDTAGPVAPLAPARAREILAAVSGLSKAVCEICGAPGRLRAAPRRVLCDDHGEHERRAMRA